jgi:DNA-binding response OmpR family regulator
LIADQELGLSRAGTTHESSNRTYTRPSGISRSLIQERHKALFKLFADNKFELLTRQNIKEKTGLTDSFLKGIVGDLRNVFGKDCIETVHGIGYRFTPK